ncbi:MAG: hypothetical protein A4E73_01581 [Syntrophaceae bacterium PtaU1.Bin231]|nr:MAG: hypothetical protein A4E73_01581 [Syntrophaceae bacterium PtaU1.Bin231]
MIGLRLVEAGLVADIDIQLFREGIDDPRGGKSRVRLGRGVRIPRQAGFADKFYSLAKLELSSERRRPKILPLVELVLIAGIAGVEMEGKRFDVLGCDENDVVGLAAGTEPLILIPRGQRYARFQGKVESVLFEKAPLDCERQVREAVFLGYRRAVFLALQPDVGIAHDQIHGIRDAVGERGGKVPAVVSRLDAVLFHGVAADFAADFHLEYALSERPGVIRRERMRRLAQGGKRQHPDQKHPQHRCRKNGQSFTIICCHLFFSS